MVLGNLAQPIRLVLGHPALKMLAACSFVSSIAQLSLTTDLVTPTSTRAWPMGSWPQGWPWRWRSWAVWSAASCEAGWPTAAWARAACWRCCHRHCRSGWCWSCSWCSAPHVLRSGAGAAGVRGLVGLVRDLPRGRSGAGGAGRPVLRGAVARQAVGAGHRWRPLSARRCVRGVAQACLRRARAARPMPPASSRASDEGSGTSLSRSVMMASDWRPGSSCSRKRMS
jgi:hypothetical protein